MYFLLFITDISHYLLSIYHVPGTLLGALHASFHLIFDKVYEIDIDIPILQMKKLRLKRLFEFKVKHQKIFFQNIVIF